MALLGNYAIFTKNPITYGGGDSVSGISKLRYNFNQAGDSRLRFYGDNEVVGVTDRCGLPANYSAPYSWVLPPKSGGVGSNVGVRGTGAFTGSGALGINIDATMEGSGTISNANLGLILSAVATLSGIGGLSADVSGALQASATLAGSGDLTGALGALAGAIATLSGSGTITGDINAKASLSADIYVNQSEASVQQIVDGVWNALAASYNTSGTMGEAAQVSGGGGGGGLTTEQAEQLGRIDTTVALNLDAKVSESGGGGGGLTEAESKHLMKLRNGGGGGAIIDGKSIEDFLKKGNAPLIRTIEKLPEEIKEKLDEKISEENTLAEEKLSDIIESKDQEIEKALGLVNTLSEKTETALKGFSEIVKTGKENTEKLLHSIEVKELEKDIGKETAMLDEKVEKQVQEELSSLDTALKEKIQRETKELDDKLEKQIQDEIKILDSKLQ